MPTALSVRFMPSSALAPTFSDLHRLACWLVEAPHSPRHWDQSKPFSTWPIRGSGDGTGESELRINWLADGQSPARLPIALGLGPRLGEVDLLVRSTRAETSTYADLRAAAGLRDCDLRFLSPTYFSRSGRDYLLPDPELMVRRLVARWNELVAQGPLGTDVLVIAAEEARELGSRVVLKAHELETVRVEEASGRPRTGFTGQIRLGLSGPARASSPAGRLLDTLCRFSTYSGIGALTTHGFGAVEAFPVHG